MSILRFAQTANYKKFYSDLKPISKQTHKPAWLMFADTALSALLFGSGLQDYLNYKFYEKSFRERKTYATIGSVEKAYRTLANIEYAPFFSNKVNFHKNFSKYTRRDYLSPDDTFENFERFLARHSEFVIKPQVGLGGSDVRKISAGEITDRKAFFAQMREQHAFLEEVIIQNEAWGVLSPGSVDTLRMMTWTVNGQSGLLFAAARIGSGKTIADNFHQGGMGVLVDLETGRLKGNGIDKTLKESEYSPTGIRFDGFPVPHWEEAKAMVLEAALVNDKVNLVGWDVAIAKNGPVIIEGNRSPGFDLVQVLLKQGAQYMLDDLLAKVAQADRQE